MKKSILIFCALCVALGLTALGIFNWSGFDTVPSCSSSQVEEDIKSEELKSQVIEPATANKFFYDVDSRFKATITREELRELKSIKSLLRETERQSALSFDSVVVTVLDDFRPTDRKAKGYSDVLNAEQVDLLHSLDYSTNILVWVNYQAKDEHNGVSYNDNSTPHITIIPEKEAEYDAGKDLLVGFLKRNSVIQTAIARQGNLLSGKVYFTVGVLGNITDVHLASSCGFPSIDAHMLDLIVRVPGKWIPAENTKGERVAQTLVYSFGSVGC